MKPFNFFKTYIDRDPFLAQLWLRVAGYQALGWVLLAVFMFTAPARAWEIPKNPDRFPSFGFNYSKLNMDGKRFEVSQPNTINPLVNSGPEESTLSSVGVDLRLPVHQSVTVGISYDRVETDFSYNRVYLGQTIYHESGNQSGDRFGFNLRLYLNK